MLKDFQGDQLKTLVENRKRFSLSGFELNVFETHVESHLIPLKFDHPVLTHMLQGKKVMHLDGVNQPFNYYPEETLIFPKDGEMLIDFPEAKPSNPTRCIALEIERDTFKNVVEEFEFFLKEETKVNNINVYESLPITDISVNSTIGRFINIVLKQDTGTEALAKLTLKELMIRLLQSKAKRRILFEYQAHINQCKFSNLVKFIKENIYRRISMEELCIITCTSRSHFFQKFKLIFGVTPIQLINSIRMDEAKKLISLTSHSITEISYKLGYRSVNHFIRTFKAYVGVNPNKFRHDVLKQKNK